MTKANTTITFITLLLINNKYSRKIAIKKAN